MSTLATHPHHHIKVLTQASRRMCFSPTSRLWDFGLRVRRAEPLPRTSKKLADKFSGKLQRRQRWTSTVTPKVPQATMCARFRRCHASTGKGSVQSSVRLRFQDRSLL